MVNHFGCYNYISGGQGCSMCLLPEEIEKSLIFFSSRSSVRSQFHAGTQRQEFELHLLKLAVMEIDS